MNSEWKLLNVDEHRLDNPDFFAYPAISLAQRATVQIGEQIKVLASLNVDGEWKTKALWVATESVNSMRFVGRPLAGYSLQFPPNQDRLIDFGPEHVYRMPPREFTIWGRGGQPLLVWGNGQHGSQPQSPDGDPISGIEPISTHTANGWLEMERKYGEMAPQKNWPSFEALTDFAGRMSR